MKGKRSERERSISLPMMTREASFQPSTLNEEARTVELTWTTGARVLRGFFERFWEELSLKPRHVRMGRLKSGTAPLLDSHDGFSGVTRSVLGVVESARIDGDQGTAVVRFSAEDHADKAFRMVKEGVLRNISVGYQVHKFQKVEADEDDEDKTPVYRAVDWEPFELSVVPMGADAGAGFRSAVTHNTCVFVTRQEQTMDPEENEVATTPTAEPGGKKKESAAVKATRAARESRIEDAKAIAAAEQAAREEATAAERERIAGIKRLAKRAKLGEIWAQTLIEDGTSVDDARAAAFDNIVTNDDEFRTDGVVRIGAGDDERDKFVRGASAWLFQRTGTRALIEAAQKKNPELFKDISFDPGEFRGYSPIELARLSLERNRVSTRGMDRMKMVGLAFTHQRTGSYQTAGDFPILLENVLGKVLLGAYTTQENTWERFCGTEQVPDFRTSNRYRTGSLPGLDVIAEHGEYKTGVIPDGSKYPLATQRMGKMFSLSQETIVNDDMGALTQMATELGRAANRSIETSVYALLALNSGLGPTQGDGQPFFHANRANVGTGSAISVVGIDADRVVMRAQKDPSGLDFLDLSPAILLVPDSLKGTAQVINDAQYDPDTANKLQRPNMVRGLFRDVIGTPRLAAASTRRYLFTDPAVAAAIVVAFLEGYGRGPVMDSVNGWRIDGVEWKVSLYAKAQMADAKAAVTNAGV